MRRLLDTNVLLWTCGYAGRLGEADRELVEAEGNEVFFSAISILEIAIKARLSRPDFKAQPLQVFDAALDMGFAELPVRSDAAALVAELPLLHRDPFDRLLVAQSIVEPATLCTADTRLEAYPALANPAALAATGNAALPCRRLPRAWARPSSQFGEAPRGQNGRSCYRCRAGQRRR